MNYAEREIEVSIVIPSYRRPHQLAKTLTSCLNQEGTSGRIEIIVVDNDAKGSAEPVVNEISGRSPIPIHYVRESRPGISQARNTGVRFATGRYLAFIDDDEEAVPGWLASFLATIRGSGADLVVGPVYPRFPAEAGIVDGYRTGVYTRDARVQTGTELRKWGGIGNTILDRNRCFDQDCPFDPKLGLSGGEDALFLRQLARHGRKLVWCAEAAVWETVPADKLTTRYILARVFRGGQLTAFLSVAIKPVEFAKLAGWMVVGSGQVVLYAPAALVLRVLGNNRWLPMLARAVSGLGKIFWHSRFHPHLYRRETKNREH